MAEEDLLLEARDVVKSFGLNLVLKGVTLTVHKGEVLSLIVLISTLSLVASLSLLIINKRDDIFILRSMGMERRTIRRAFLAEGLLICAIAVVLGLALGFLVCWLQQTFGIIRMGDGNFVVSAFPVSMRAVDFLVTFLLVMAISTLSVALTVRRARVE